MIDFFLIFKKIDEMTSQYITYNNSIMMGLITILQNKENVYYISIFLLHVIFMKIQNEEFFKFC